MLSLTGGPNQEPSSFIFFYDFPCCCLTTSTSPAPPWAALASGAWLRDLWAVHLPSTLLSNQPGPAPLLRRSTKHRCPPSLCGAVFTYLCAPPTSLLPPPPVDPQTRQASRTSSPFSSDCGVFFHLYVHFGRCNICPACFLLTLPAIKKTKQNKKPLKANHHLSPVYFSLPGTHHLLFCPPFIISFCSPSHPSPSPPLWRWRPAKE